MSRTKHTPGPWHAVRLHQNADTRCWECDIESSHGGQGVSLIGKVEGGHHTQECCELVQANARLIKAAPKLLAACKAFLDIDNPPAGEPGHVDFNTAVEMMRAGVAEAEPQ